MRCVPKPLGPALMRVRRSFFVDHESGAAGSSGEDGQALLAGRGDHAPKSGELFGRDGHLRRAGNPNLKEYESRPLNERNSSFYTVNHFEDQVLIQ